MRVLGEEQLHEYCHKYALKIPKEVKKLMSKSSGEFEKRPFTDFINGKN